MRAYEFGLDRSRDSHKDVIFILRLTRYIHVHSSSMAFLLVVRTTLLRPSIFMLMIDPAAFRSVTSFATAASSPRVVGASRIEEVKAKLNWDTIIYTIAGAAPSWLVCAIHALIDFLCQAQPFILTPISI